MFFCCCFLLCRKFVIVENYALIGVKFVCLKFGWCKENEIFHVCSWCVSLFVSLDRHIFTFTLVQRSPLFSLMLWAVTKSLTYASAGLSCTAFVPFGLFDQIMSSIEVLYSCAPVFCQSQLYMLMYLIMGRCLP